MVPLHNMAAQGGVAQPRDRCGDHAGATTEGGVSALFGVRSDLHTEENPKGVQQGLTETCQAPRVLCFDSTPLQLGTIH